MAVKLQCSDCPTDVTGYMTPTALAKGSSIREPGEPLCRGCTSRRIKMVREVDALPRTLADIKAKRMSVGVA